MDEEDLNPWAWAQQDRTRELEELSEDWVTAVMVTRNSEKWVMPALESLAEMTIPPHRLIVIDNQSSDATPQLLEQAAADGLIDAHYTGDASWGMSQAVDAALAHDAEQRRHQQPVWIWLLHDDMRVMPNALEALLRRATASDGDIIIPKLLQGSRRGASRQISEIGVSISGLGNRVSDIGQGEFDQGQHESRHVLGGSTCGMLIRREAYEAVGGMDPDVTLFRVGTEIGWRANLAGYHVVTEPEAAIMHLHLGRAGLREGLPGNPTVIDRRNGMMTVASHARGARGVGRTVWLVLAGFLSALGFLIGKAPKRAWEELQAVGAFLMALPRVGRMRRRNFSLPATRESMARTRALRPRRGAGLHRLLDDLSAWLSELWAALFGGLSSETSLDELIGDDFAESGRRRGPRRPWLLPTFIMFGVVLGLTFIAARGLYGVGGLSSTRLNPAPTSFGSFIAQYVAPVVGAPTVVSPPWMGLLAIASLVTFGQPDWLITLLVVGAVPITMALAYTFLRHLLRDRRLRLVGALIWAILPPLLGATARGDLTTIILAMLTPVMGQAVIGWRRRGTTGVERWRGPFAVALVLTVMASFLPAIYVVALGGGLVTILRDRRFISMIRVAVALLAPIVVLAPWLPTLVRWPGRLVTGASPQLVPLAPADPFLLLVGRTPGAGLPAPWISVSVTLIVWVVALIGLALRPARSRWWFGLAFLGLAGAELVSRLLVAAPPSGQLVRPDATPWLMLTFTGLLCAALIGWDGIGAHLASRNFGLTQALAVVVLGAVAWAALIGVGSWVASGLGGPLGRARQVQPAFIVQAQREAQLRTLAIDVRDQDPAWALIEGDGSRVGSEERGGVLGGSLEATTLARQCVADLTNGVADQDLANRLKRLGVGYIQVTGGGSDLHAAIGAMPGLSAAMGDNGTLMWRLTTALGGVTIEGLDAKRVDGSPTTVPASAAGRTLVIDQPRDPRWYASLNGRALPVVEVNGDYRQMFALDPDRTSTGDGGELTWGLSAPVWWAWLQLAGLVLLLVLAAPSLRSTSLRDPAQYARFASRMEETR